MPRGHTEKILLHTAEAGIYTLWLYDSGSTIGRYGYRRHTVKIKCNRNGRTTWKSYGNYGTAIIAFRNSQIELFTTGKRHPHAAPPPDRDRIAGGD